MNLTDLFPEFETDSENFPAALCTKPNSDEKDVLDSDALFLCVIVDPYHPVRFEVKILSPYTCKDLDPIEGSDGVLYGWTDGPNTVDHKDRSVHLDNARVVAWKQVEQDSFDFPMWKDEWR